MARLAHHLLVRLAHHNVEHLVVDRGTLVFKDFQEAIAPLGADALHSRIVGSLRDTDGCAVVVVANTDAL